MITTTETETAPAERHWLTRYDPDDGEPYGQLCDCPIGRHHDGHGDLSEPDDEAARPDVAATAPDETTEPSDLQPTPDFGDSHNAEPLTLTEVIAEQLCHTRVIDGQYHRFKAVDHGDGRIELDVTRVEFAAAVDTTMRLLLHVSGPLTPAEDVVEAEIDETGVEIGASA